VTQPRFFAPDLDPSEGETVLPPDESHHLVSVLRIGVGDEVAVFDGEGHEYRARVERADRRRTAVRILEAIATAPERAVPTVLVQAVLKGDKMDGVIRDATMAGVARIVPVVTERSIVSLSSLAKSHAGERWRRVAVSSAKQCRRARLPVVDPAGPLHSWLDSPFDGLRLLFVEPSPDAPERKPMRDILAGHNPRSVACVVGPEGGWSAGERDAAIRAGCAPVTLGSVTLRADVVGLVAVSLVSFAFDRG
jgi:16S rRNA (uracil1498-N3)-methyltransferase